MALDIATKHVRFSGRLLMLGCGSIGQGVLPLLLRHIDMPRDKISILTSDTRGSAVAAHYGIAEEILTVTRENYREVISARVGTGRFSAEPLRRYLLRGADRTLPRAWRAVSRHLRRTLGRRLYRPLAHPIAALQLRIARKRPGAAHG